MKVLLAILSCARDQHLERLQRETFLRDCPVDHRFFRGFGPRLPAPCADTVFLDVDDGFPSLPFKTGAALRWALAEGYDYVFKCDTDTYARPERLLASGFEASDYAGYFRYDPGPGAYASGGSGYWLSRKAMEIAADYAFFLDHQNHERFEPSTRGEDLQVGWAMRDAGILCRKDERYRLTAPGPTARNYTITLHDVAQPDKARRIPEAHREWLASGGR